MALLISALAVLLAASPSSLAQPTHPLTPSQEQDTFHFADRNLTADLIVAEPAVEAPVAMAWDAKGSLFVVEMTDYPSGPGFGRVALLVPDAEGRYARKSVFADRLSFPTGVMPWQDGLLVTAAPDIWFFRDRDGDGVAEERTRLLTGFAEGNQQLRVNGLFWGIDNWIYGANGRSDGDVRWTDVAGAPISIRRHDFRFRPDARLFEPVAGNSQFGMGHDDWGGRFPVFNNIPVRQVVLEDEDVARAPGLPWPDPVQDIGLPAEGKKLYPLSHSTLWVPQPSGFQTSACGPTLHRGSGLGLDYVESLFVCEPVQNLITRRVLDKDGVQFTSRRARGETNQEFLSSTDTWFHPVFTATGPDGALWCIDFYRNVVEHPHWVSEAVRARVPWREGETNGRIWRIRSKDWRVRFPKIALAEASTSELVRELGNENGWWRDTASRLLYERQDRSAVVPLREMLTSSFPEARVRALYHLRDPHALRRQDVLSAFRDPHAGVRATALRLIDSISNAGAQTTTLDDEFGSALIPMLEDPAATVRAQVALHLSSWPRDEKYAALARLARAAGADRWQALAVLAGASGHPWRLFQELDRAGALAPLTTSTDFLGDLLVLIGRTAPRSDLDAWLRWFQQKSDHLDPELKVNLIRSLADGLRESGKDLASLTDSLSAEDRPAGHAFEEFLGKVESIVLSTNASPQLRSSALPLFVECKPTSARRKVLDLLAPDEPQQVQTAAAQALVSFGAQTPAEAAFASWATYTRQTRQALIRAAARSIPLSLACLRAVEQGIVSPLELRSDPATLETIRRNQDPEVRRCFTRVRDRLATEDRSAVLERFRPALEQAGQREHGGFLFGQVCQVCHSIQGVGNNVGPDLADVASHDKETLLVDILDPSSRVLPDFLSYTCLMQDGESLVGRVVSENASNILLRRPNEPDLSIPRIRIKELKADGKSLMPDGLEATMTLKDMADLLEFLQHPDPTLLPKSIPQPHPR